MTKTLLARAAAACAALYLLPGLALACDDCDGNDAAAPVAAAAAGEAPRNKLALVRVQSVAPSSLPTNIPTTRETVTRADIERTINATDSQDALKYLPSLLVRKRYIGDYNHAILSSRASGTGNSARYSGRQYRTLNNADVNGATYMGVSKYATADVRVLWKIDRQWSAAFGIDNLNNDRYWNFHNYPQRSYSAELKFDL